MPESRARCARSKNNARSRDRKSTRLNSSHSQISYAVFCLKKKKDTLRQSGHAIVPHFHLRLPLLTEFYADTFQVPASAPQRSVLPPPSAHCTHSSVRPGAL